MRAVSREKLICKPPCGKAKNNSPQRNSFPAQRTRSLCIPNEQWRSMQDKPRSVILEKIIVITLLVTIDISELIPTSHTLPNLVVPRLASRNFKKFTSQLFVQKIIRIFYYFCWLYAFTIFFSNKWQTFTDVKKLLLIDCWLQIELINQNHWLCDGNNYD